MLRTEVVACGVTGVPRASQLLNRTPTSQTLGRGVKRDRESHTDGEAAPSSEELERVEKGVKFDSEEAVAAAAGGSSPAPTEPAPAVTVDRESLTWRQRQELDAGRAPGLSGRARLHKFGYARYMAKMGMGREPWGTGRK